MAKDVANREPTLLTMFKFGEGGVVWAMGRVQRLTILH